MLRMVAHSSINADIKSGFPGYSNHDMHWYVICVLCKKQGVHLRVRGAFSVMKCENFWVRQCYMFSDSSLLDRNMPWHLIGYIQIMAFIGMYAL